MKDSLAVVEEFRNYAYSVSHDVSAPVRTMVQFSKLLSMEHAAHLGPDGQEYLNLIVESGQKLQSMMNELLLFSRLMTVPRQVALVNMTQLLGTCLMALHDRAKELQADIQLDDLPAVWGDRGQLAQLVSILLDNALKFHRPDVRPLIHISAEHVAGHWRFMISDNGIGIPSEFHEAVYKPFAHLHLEEDYRGTGMSLARARKIVELHGGVLDHVPVLTGGTLFHFTLAEDGGGT